MGEPKMHLHVKPWEFFRALVVVLAAVGSCGVALACNVPVFRYALEHWRADPYQLVLVYRGPLGAVERDLADELAEEQEAASTAYVLRTVDVATLDEDAAEELLAATGEGTLPAVLVHYPASVGIERPFAQRPFDRAELNSLLRSPARDELVRRLAQGQTAVWLLLECGDPALDDPAAAIIEAELKKLEKDLKLPELTEAPEDNLSSALPLTVSFSVLRLPRSDGEAALVAMLLGSEADLKDEAVPLVFPVFGRGRALLPMIGKGITAENTHDYAEFLVSACSCEVKEQNPGFDLLLTADWDEQLGRQGVAIDSKPVAPAGPPQLVPIPPGAASPVATTDTTTTQALAVPSTPRTPWVIAGVIGVCLLLGAFLRPLRKRA